MKGIRKFAGWFLIVSAVAYLTEFAIAAAANLGIDLLPFVDAGWLLFIGFFTGLAFWGSLFAYPVIWLIDYLATRLAKQNSD
jgi:hypothetical protein